jgi:hypothetical protein
MGPVPATLPQRAELAHGRTVVVGTREQATSRAGIFARGTSFCWSLKRPVLGRFERTAAETGWLSFPDPETFQSPRGASLRVTGPVRVFFRETRDI